MKRLTNIITAVMLLTTTNIAAQDIIKMIVGTYDDTDSRGMYSFNMNQKDGTATPVDTLDMSNPSYLTLSKNGRMIYVVSEQNDKTASVSAVAFDNKTGKMTLVNTQPVNGEDPCHVATNGKIVLTSNYTGGSMSVFDINEDGSLGKMKAIFKGNTGGTDTVRQATPHVHCAMFTPDGNHIVASDFSADHIMKYDVAGGRNVTEAGMAGSVSRESGPRHIIFSNNGLYAYVISELSGTVTVFREHKGNMVNIQEVRCDSVGARGSADIHMSPDGRYVYASNRLKADGISIFAVNHKNGMLTKVGYQLTGTHPRNFNITPNGKFLLCACRDSNKIQVFRIDKNTGLLTDTHNDIDMKKPVCVMFYPRK